MTESGSPSSGSISCANLTTVHYSSPKETFHFVNSENLQSVHLQPSCSDQTKASYQSDSDRQKSHVLRKDHSSNLPAVSPSRRPSIQSQPLPLPQLLLFAHSLTLSPSQQHLKGMEWEVIGALKHRAACTEHSLTSPVSAGMGTNLPFRLQDRNPFNPEMSPDFTPSEDLLFRRPQCLLQQYFSSMQNLILEVWFEKNLGSLIAHPMWLTAQPFLLPQY